MAGRMMTFSRWRFYRNNFKPSTSMSTLNSQAEYFQCIYNSYRIVQLVSEFSSNCPIRNEESASDFGDKTVKRDYSDLDLDQEIKATKELYNKKRMEVEAKLKGIKYKGSYKNEGALHVPVLLNEVLNCFTDLKNKTILDMTFGSGGHTKAVLEGVPGSHVLALDRDPVAIQLAQELSETFPGMITPMLGRFSDLPKLLHSQGVKLDSIGGVVMDLGASSMQFDQSDRGFSLSMNGPLDMRMDTNRLEEMPTAADVVNTLDERDLRSILRTYGEERKAANIAHGIVEARSAYGRISTTHQLADIVEAACGGASGKDKLGRHAHPATKTFQALRIFVNNEMNELDIGIRIAHKFLEIGGVCVAIGFHSLEEKLIKHHFYDIHMDETHDKYFKHRHRSRTHISGIVHSVDEMLKLTERNWKPFDNGAFTPKDEEILRNPRSRSAIMYAAEKIR